MSVFYFSCNAAFCCARPAPAGAVSRATVSGSDRIPGSLTPTHSGQISSSLNQRWYVEFTAVSCVLPGAKTSKKPFFWSFQMSGSWKSPPWLKCPPQGPASARCSCCRGLCHGHCGCELLFMFEHNCHYKHSEHLRVLASRKSVSESMEWGAAGVKLSKSAPFLEKCFWFMNTGHEWAGAGAPGEALRLPQGTPHSLALQEPQGTSLCILLVEFSHICSYWEHSIHTGWFIWLFLCREDVSEVFCPTCAGVGGQGMPQFCLLWG